MFSMIQNALASSGFLACSVVGLFASGPVAALIAALGAFAAFVAAIEDASTIEDGDAYLQ